MKTMTCKDLGGACGETFQADTFEQMGEMSKSHAMAMLDQGDKDHIDAMGKMQKVMSDPKAMEKWMTEKQAEFDALSS